MALRETSATFVTAIHAAKCGAGAAGAGCGGPGPRQPEPLAHIAHARRPPPSSRLIPADGGAPPAAGTIVPVSTPASLSIIPVTTPRLRAEGSGQLDPAAPPADAQVVTAERITPPYLISPSLGGGMPSGYAGGWGDYYIAGSAGTPGKTRDGSPDAALNLGFSLGDPVRSLGLDVNWGIGSIKDFNANGSVGVSVGRILVNRPDLQVAVAGGLLDAFAYGNEPGKPPVSGYGAITVALPLRPGDRRFPQRLQLSAGGGGGSSFGAIDANFQTTEAGFFVAAGVDVLPNLGLSVGQSSRSTNVNVSWIPLRGLPIFVNVVVADVFDATPFGTVGVLSVGWGDSLQRGVL